MKLEVFVRNPHNYDVNLASDEAGLKCEDDSLTVQSDAQEADINVILKRFNVTGQLPVVTRVPQYGDFSQVIDYHTAMQAIRRANEAFMELPAQIRSKFGNDPGAFVDFCSDPDNLPELRKMGLAPEAEKVDERQVRGKEIVDDEAAVEAGSGGSGSRESVRDGSGGGKAPSGAAS